MTTYPIAALATLMLIGSPAQAQDHHDHNHDDQQAASGISQEAHVHGIAELFVVLEGEWLDIELHSPAMNLLGFEHQASSSEERAKINRVKDTLANADSLFQLGSAQCQLIEYALDFSSVIEEHAEHGEKHRGNDHHDEEHHDEEHHDEERHDNEAHDTDHHDTHHQSESHKDADRHSDIEATYHYRCKQPDRLDSLMTTIPAQFTGVESLKAQWIINGRQGAVTLDNSQRNVHFR